MAKLIQQDPEPGAPCRDFFCTGTLDLDPDNTCTCSISNRPPCYACEHPKLVCVKCGRYPDEQV